MDLELTYLNTDEYAALTFILGNRAVNESYVKKLRLEIEHNGGNIPARKDWILVINDKNEVVDGQCHIEAIRQYNRRHQKKTIPMIACTVEPGAGLDRAKELNNSNTKWTDKDHIHSNIQLGHMDYVFLSRVMDSGLLKRAGGLKVVLGVCMGFDTPGLKNKFHKGEFEMLCNESFAIEMLGYLARCRACLNKTFGHYSSAAPVLFDCLRLRDTFTEKDIERARLEAAINNADRNWTGRINGHTKRFMFSDNPTDILNNIHIAYNHGLRKGDPAYFDVVNVYEDVKCHNHQNARNAHQEPTRREVPTIEPEMIPNAVSRAEINPPQTIVNTIIPSIPPVNLRDNGVVPV